MTGKLIGAVLIIAGCAGFGFSLASGKRKEEACFRGLIGAMDLMQCELQYNLTALPELCAIAAGEQKGPVSQFFLELSRELSAQVNADVPGCVREALQKTPPFPGNVEKAIGLLGASLGRFDAAGQLKGLKYVRAYCREEVAALSENKEARLRSYQTLGLCAGAALAILFV